MFVSIDPGTNTGWALWGVDGLKACGLGDPRSSELHLAESITDAWIERPKVYPRSPARPDDIVTLAINAGEWGGTYRTLVAEVHYVTPAEWKGQLPKDIHHARVWAALKSEEQEIVTRACKGMAPSKRHNVLDAVGLGLWARTSKGAK